MTAAQEQLVVDHSGLTRKLAFAFARRTRAPVDVDDLLGAANIGLVEAALRYTSGAGVSFAAFAQRRIVGAMYDLLRREHVGSRTELHAWRDRRNAAATAERPFDEPRPGLSFLSLDVPDEDGTATLTGALAIEEQFEEKLQVGEIIAAIDTLSLRERTVLYSRLLGIKQTELADRLHVTEGRVAQLSSRANRRVRQRLAA